MWQTPTPIQDASLTILTPHFLTELVSIYDKKITI